MKKHIPSFLLYGSALFQAIQFAISGHVYFGWPGILTGLFGGALVNVCISVAASRISDIAKKRRGLAYVGLIALMTLSPACVAPGLLQMASRALPGHLALLVAIVWAIAPDVAIMTSGAIAGKGLVRIEETQIASHTPVVRKKKSDTKRTCPQCGATVANANAYSAHMRWQHPRPIPVDLYSEIGNHE